VRIYWNLLTNLTSEKTTSLVNPNTHTHPNMELHPDNCHNSHGEQQIGQLGIKLFSCCSFCIIYAKISTAYRLHHLHSIEVPPSVPNQPLNAKIKFFLAIPSAKTPPVLTRPTTSIITPSSRPNARRCWCDLHCDIMICTATLSESGMIGPAVRNGVGRRGNYLDHNSVIVFVCIQIPLPILP